MPRPLCEDSGRGIPVLRTRDERQASMVTSSHKRTSSNNKRIRIRRTLNTVLTVALNNPDPNPAPTIEWHTLAWRPLNPATSNAEQLQIKNWKPVVTVPGTPRVRAEKSLVKVSPATAHATSTLKDSEMQDKPVKVYRGTDKGSSWAEEYTPRPTVKQKTVEVVRKLSERIRSN